MGIFKDNWGRYRELGFIPYPSSKKGKNPLVEWKGGAIPTNDLYSEWEKKHPDANLWVYLGNSFAVIDPDGPGAEEYVKSLNLPNCPTSISGKKSTHRWFKVSSPIKPLKVSNGEDQTFLELRTGSQGMLVPPSVHPETGKAYEWLKGHSPWDIPFPEFPGEAYERVKALLNKPAPKMEPATDGPEGSLDVKKYLDHHGIKYQIKLDGQRTIYALESAFSLTNTRPLQFKAIQVSFKAQTESWAITAFIIIVAFGRGRMQGRRFLEMLQSLNSVMGIKHLEIIRSKTEPS